MSDATLLYTVMYDHKLLADRWTTFMYRDDAGRWVEYRRVFDMNADGVVSLSDVGLWLGWLFWLPGDYLILVLMNMLPPVATFLELGPDNLAGGLSGFASVVAWVAALLMTLSFIDATKRFLDDIARNGL